MTRISTQAPRPARSPRATASDLLTQVVVQAWCLIGSARLFWISGEAETFGARWFLAGVAGLYLVLALALFRNWLEIRWAVGAVFAADAAYSLALPAVAPVLFLLWAPLRDLWILLSFWLAVHLLGLSSVGRRTGTQHARAHFDAAGFTARLIGLALVFGLAKAVVEFGLAPWLPAVVSVLVVLVYGVAAKERVRRGLSFLLARRPGDLTRAGWRVFRQAWSARTEARLDEAASLLVDLPDSRSVSVLKSLVVLDRTQREGLLERLVFDAAFVPTKSQRTRVAAHCTRIDLAALLDERTALLDTLLAGAEVDFPPLNEEIEYAVEQVTGRSTAHGLAAVREWWEGVRPKPGTPDAWVWLVARLWSAECLSAAERVASRTQDALLGEAASLARMLEEWPAKQWPLEWTESRSWNLCLIPSFGDNLGLLLVDGPFINDYGLGPVADRLTLRLELVRTLQNLWSKYERELAVEVPWLLFHLTGRRVRDLQTPTCFHAWWAPQAEAQERFDRTFESGLRAVARRDWSEAAEAFGEASAAWPARTCALYNQATALMQVRQYAAAEPILRRLTESEPKEPLWWKSLGECLMKLRRGEEALKAFDQTALDGAGLDVVAVRRGVTLAMEGRDDEAESALSSAVGPDPDVDTLEELSSLLESEGAYGLAQRYRERAFYKGLAHDPTESNEDETDTFLSD